MNKYSLVNSTLYWLLMVAYAATALAVTQEEAVALQDRQQFQEADWPFIYYVTTYSGHPSWGQDEHKDKVEISEQEQLRVAMNFVFSQMAPKQPVLERCLPKPVQGSATLFRIDLRDLVWPVESWTKLIANYPYSDAQQPLVTRVDWLLLQLTDCQENPAYYELTFGAVPKSRDDALKTFGVNIDKGVQRGVIAGKSRLSHSGVRRIINFPTNFRSTAYLTEDTLKLKSKQDPIESPDGSVPHDGEEGIIMVEKIVAATGDTGMCMVYFLANGKGEIVNRAPVDLVKDYTELRRLPEIRNAVSCMGCHVNGWQEWNTNEFRDYIKSGVELYADYETSAAIEAFHMIDLNKQLQRNNEDYQLIIKAACGVSAIEAVNHFRSRIDSYSTGLVPIRAAHELELTLPDLRLALAYANSNNYALGARVSGLAHGKGISRDAWEEQYLAIYNAVEAWRKVKE